MPGTISGLKMLLAHSSGHKKRTSLALTIRQVELFQTIPINFFPYSEMNEPNWRGNGDSGSLNID